MTSFNIHTSRKIYSGLRVSSHKVTLYRAPLLMSVVRCMPVPDRSVEDTALSL
jgi:hypothetical protein